MKKNEFIFIIKEYYEPLDNYQGRMMVCGLYYEPLDNYQGRMVVCGLYYEPLYNYQGRMMVCRLYNEPLYNYQGRMMVCGLNNYYQMGIGPSKGICFFMPTRYYLRKNLYSIPLS